jgi:hypothetical protein
MHQRTSSLLSCCTFRACQYDLEQQQQQQSVNVDRWAACRWAFIRTNEINELIVFVFISLAATVLTFLIVRTRSFRIRFDLKRLVPFSFVDRISMMNFCLFRSFNLPLPCQKSLINLISTLQCKLSFRVLGVVRSLSAWCWIVASIRIVFFSYLCTFSLSICISVRSKISERERESRIWRVGCQFFQAEENQIWSIGRW